uniref:Uncharacterized protein n=1 Tax=Arundo donax TaxID=35708 RepID=A0A0A9ENF2_ARUDO
MCFTKVHHRSFFTVHRICWHFSWI